MKLKNYQKKSVEQLEEFLELTQKHGPKMAYMSQTETPYKSESFGEIPNICMKLPTGAGKTLVGCHALEKIMSTVLQNKLDHGIVLWFTPSEAIKSQTLKKFKDRKDGHRKIIDEAFDNSVKVFDNAEALSISKSDVANNLCIIIASLDAFRKEKSKQSKYKVYQENGSLMDHFQNIDEKDFLERDSHKTVINSLANVVRLSNPLIVIDEGHKTKTLLSDDVLNDLNPSFIIEYTATPRSASNILVEIHASELKSEDMVKIPIELVSAPQWQSVIEQGIEKRNELEKTTKKKKDAYIRPIALLQAEADRNDDKVTVEKIKDFLIERKIPEEEIAIKTSKKNDLEGVDLFSKRCKIRYIITVNALAEGWDCSFAYVLVSVANLGAKIAVEQIIGRIIRMPYAKRNKEEELNRSYIFASARNFNESANQIISGLENNGYSRSDFIDARKKDEVYELEVDRNKPFLKEKIEMPHTSLGEEKLSFGDLVGEEFELAKQDTKFDFEIHYDSDGKALIDIMEDDNWVRSAQKSLNLVTEYKTHTEAELLRWLDKKLRFPILKQSDKSTFLKKAINHQLSSNKKTLSELSVNRYVLFDKLSEVINGLLEKQSKKRFDEFLKKGKVKVKKFEAFPDKITLKQLIPQEYAKNLYANIDKLNKEEAGFVGRLDLDNLPNIKYWVRSREKVDPFYIQGWKKNKFYPDFVAVTKKGNAIALEWKGGDRISNDDTTYKVEIGDLWAKLGGSKLHFLLVHNGNIERILTALKTL